MTASGGSIWPTTICAPFALALVMNDVKSVVPTGKEKSPTTWSPFAAAAALYSGRSTTPSGSLSVNRAILWLVGKRLTALMMSAACSGSLKNMSQLYFQPLLLPAANAPTGVLVVR